MEVDPDASSLFPIYDVEDLVEFDEELLPVYHVDDIVGAEGLSLVENIVDNSMSVENVVDNPMSVENEQLLPVYHVDDIVGAEGLSLVENVVDNYMSVENEEPSLSPGIANGMCVKNVVQFEDISLSSENFEESEEPLLSLSPIHYMENEPSTEPSLPEFYIGKVVWVKGESEDQLEPAKVIETEDVIENHHFVKFFGSKNIQCIEISNLIPFDNISLDSLDLTDEEYSKAVYEAEKCNRGHAGEGSESSSDSECGNIPFITAIIESPPSKTVTPAKEKKQRAPRRKQYIVKKTYSSETELKHVRKPPAKCCDKKKEHVHVMITALPPSICFASNIKCSVSKKRSVEGLLKCRIQMSVHYNIGLFANDIANNPIAKKICEKYQAFQYDLMPTKKGIPKRSSLYKCRSVEELIGKSDVLFFCDKKPATVKEVLEAITPKFKPKKPLIIFSLLDSRNSVILDEYLKKLNSTYLEVALYPVDSESSAMNVFAAGDKSLFDGVEGILACLGKVFYFGEAGNIGKANLICNSIFGTMLIGVSEMAAMSGQLFDLKDGSFMDAINKILSVSETLPCFYSVAFKEMLSAVLYKSSYATSTAVGSSSQDTSSAVDSSSQAASSAVGSSSQATSVAVDSSQATSFAVDSSSQATSSAVDNFSQATSSVAGTSSQATSFAVDSSQATNSDVGSSSQAASSAVDSSSQATSSAVDSSSQATSSAVDIFSQATSSVAGSSSQATSFAVYSSSQATNSDVGSSSQATSSAVDSFSQATSSAAGSSSRATSFAAGSSSQATSSAAGSSSQATRSALKSAYGRLNFLQKAMEECLYLAKHCKEDPVIMPVTHAAELAMCRKDTLLLSVARLMGKSDEDFDDENNNGAPPTSTLHRQ